MFVYLFVYLTWPVFVYLVFVYLVRLFVRLFNSEHKMYQSYLFTNTPVRLFVRLFNSQQWLHHSYMFTNRVFVYLFVY